ncbi:protein of unknown function [Methylocaldum szegediense]|uniref:Uncharacterized protein n=1 Tax=Methylocaldum szegediense TaxID=73780 RepID=A0ABM9HX00_9GAMM|nr:protein of unknown function [Methylocaldum szegediense]
MHLCSIVFIRSLSKFHQSVMNARRNTVHGKTPVLGCGVIGERTAFGAPSLDRFSRCSFA